MLVVINKNQQNQLELLNNIIKNSTVIYYEGFRKPFNNIKSDIKNATGDRIEFIEGFINYMIDNGHEEAILVPGNEYIVWNSKETKVALGSAYLSKVDQLCIETARCNLYILDGVEQKKLKIVPGLSVQTFVNFKELAVAVLSKSSSTAFFSVHSSDTSLKKRKEAASESSAKRQKNSNQDVQDEGEIFEDSPFSKRQPSYLIWDKYIEPSPPAYPEASLGAILLAANSINSRADVFGRR